jgi:AcrR family transcriptional regulator
MMRAALFISLLDDFTSSGRIQPKMSSRRGRRPGDSGTREAILAAARARFAASGYDRTRIRDVAADAGVDPALVHYFFKTKDGLFAAVMQFPVRPSEVIAPLLDEGVAGLGERVLRRVLGLWDDEAVRGSLLAMINSVTAQPEAQAALREFITRELRSRLASAIEADRPELRATLCGSQMAGLLIARYVIGVEPLASLDREEVVRIVAPTLQRYLEGPL